MSRVLHRSIAHRYPVAAGGKGIRLFDTDGKDYIDASGGAAVSCLGHGHPDVLAAMHAQLDELAFAHTSFFTSAAAEELGDDLAMLVVRYDGARDVRDGVRAYRLLETS